jgi:hypothetical protein
MNSDLEGQLMEGPRPDEDPATFEARLSMLERLEPELRVLRQTGLGISTEPETSLGRHTELHSDLVIQFGDLRIRLILQPRSPGNDRQSRAIASLSSYLLANPDTDAVALVADDDELTTMLFDVYEAHSLQRSVPEARPFRSAVSEFLASNALAIELPDFRGVVALPTTDDLAQLARETVHRTFDAVKSQKARISEKITALESLTPHDESTLASIAETAVRGGESRLDVLIPDELDDVS